MEIISSCNQKCIYCYNEEIIKKIYQLDLKTIKTILSDAKEMGVDIITLSGGEPLLHKNFFEILEFCKVNEISVNIISNATLITEKAAKKLSNYNPGIQFTLDSGIPEIHDLSRGMGTFEKQIHALNLLKSSGYEGAISARMNVWRKNFDRDNLESVFKFAVEHEIQYLDIALAHDTSQFHDSLSEPKHLVQLGDAIGDLEKKFTQIKVNYQEKEVSVGCPFTAESKEVGFNVRISPEGDVYPCQMFDQKQFSFGNIKVSSISDIINSDKCFNFLELMNLRKHFIPKCQDCGYQFLCNAGCPAKAIFSHGTIFAVEGICKDRKKMFGNGLLSLMENTIS